MNTALAALQFHRFRIDLVLDEVFAVSAARRAVLWRGAVGYVLREQVCHAMDLDCDECVMRPVCPYAQMFAPRRAHTDRHNYAQLPAPYILADPAQSSPALPAGQNLGLQLTLIGSSVSYLPFLVSTMRQLGKNGLTVHHNDGPPMVRFEVRQIVCIDAADVSRFVVFAQDRNLIRQSNLPLHVRDFMRPGDKEARRIRVRFLTPVLLPDDQQLASFAHFLRCAVFRVRDLAQAFCGASEHPEDEQLALKEAHRIRCTAADLVRAPPVARISRETGQRHDVKGFLGSVVYEGPELAAYLPWLRAAEMVCIGKHIAFGNGKIAVEVLS